ncbi:Sugar phosphate permease [Sphingobium faniae]|nr:Sugar phosphate permease [Sphingobium faniae]
MRRFSATSNATEAGPANARFSPQSRLLLAMLLAVYTCNFVDRYIMSLLLEPLRHEFNLSDRQLGIMGSLVYGLAYAMAGIPMGLLVDRISRKKLITVTLLLWSSLTALSAAATSYVSMLIIRSGVGAAESAAAPASYSMIADSFPPSRRATAAGIFFVASPLGLFISFAGGGYLVAEYGWRAAFLVAGLPGVVLAVLTLLLLREPERGRYDRAAAQSHDPIQPAPLMETLRYLANDRLLLCMIGALMLTAMSAASMTAWTASYFVRLHDLPLRDVGLLIATLGGLAIIVGSAGSGWLADRLAGRDIRWPLWLAGCGALLAMLCGLLMAYAGTLAIAAIGMFLYKGMAATHIGPSFATTINNAPVSMRGTIMSIQQVALNFVGFGLGPLVTGILSDGFGGGDSLRPAIAMTLAINLPAALMLLIAAWQVQKRAQAQSGPSLSAGDNI